MVVYIMVECISEDAALVIGASVVLDPSGNTTKNLLQELHRSHEVSLSITTCTNCMEAKLELEYAGSLALSRTQAYDGSDVSSPA